MLHRQTRLGASSFELTGFPTAIHHDARTRRIAVGSSLYPTGWSGYVLDRGVAGVYRAAVYDDTSLALLAITDELRYPVTGFAFHPSATVIALATGRYDGGYFFGGDLVFWDLDRREVRSALTTSRQVVSCAFEEGGTALRVGFRPVTDDDDEEAHTVVFQGRVERSDWLSHDRWLDPDAI